MKVLLLIDGLRRGGKERQFVELAKGLALQKDILLTLVSMSSENQFGDLFDVGQSFAIIDRKYKYDLSVLPRLYSLCTSFSPDIIHSWSAMTSVYAIPIVKILGIKLINGIIRDASNHSLFDKSYLLSRFTFPFSDVVVANSNAGLSAYKVPKNLGRVIPNGFDLHRLKDLEAENIVRQSLQIKTSKVVGMLANFTDNKDYETYIIAAQIVLEKRNDTTFLAVGSGTKLEKIRGSVDKKYRDRLLFTGRIQKVESIINILNVGVLSTHGEGLSNSIMEYMALGKPVVAVDSGGTNELVRDGITGFLVPHAEPKIMAQCIGKLLDNNDLALRLGENGKRQIKENFTLNRMTEDYLELYSEIIHSK